MSRDLTDAQFKAALARNRIRKELCWFYRTDLPAVGIGAVVHPRTGKIMRRATLAKVLGYKEKSFAAS